jgi:hypothetical protein
MDDGDSKNKTHKTKQKEKINVVQRYIINVSDVLSSVWLRCPIQTNNGYKWFLLDSRRRFLFYFRLFLVVLYLTFEIFKN